MSASISNEAAAIPFVVLGETRRRVLESKLAKCANSWRQNWSTGAERDLKVSVAPMTDDSRELFAARACTIATAKTTGRFGVVAALSNDAIASVLGLPDSVAGNCTQGSVASNMVNKMTCALVREVLFAAQYQPAQVEAAVASGDEIASLPFAHWWCAEIESGIALLLSPQVVTLLTPGNRSAVAGSLEKRRAAIVEETVPLQAILGYAEVSVGDLASLRVNDVIVLSSSLAQPARLCNRDGRQVASVTLGRVEGKRAVAIAKP